MIGHFKEIKYIDVNPYTMEPFRTDSLDERIKRLRSFFFEDAKVESNDPPKKGKHDNGWKTPNQEESAGNMRRVISDRPITNVLRETISKNPRPYPFHVKCSPMNAVGDSSWKTSNLEEKVETIKRTIGDRSVISSISRSHSFGPKQSPVAVVNDNKWKKPLPEGRTQVFRPITERPVVPREVIKKNSSSDKASFNSLQIRVTDDNVLKKPKTVENTQVNEYSVGRQSVVATVSNEPILKNYRPNVEPKKPVTENTEDNNSQKQVEKPESNPPAIKKRQAALLKAKEQYNKRLLKILQRRISKANKRLTRVNDPTFRKKDEAIFERIWRKEEEEDIRKLLEECVVNTVAALEAEIKEEKLVVEENAENEGPSVCTPPDASPLIDVVTVDDEPRIQMNPPPGTSIEVPLMQSTLVYSQSFSQSMNVAVPYNYPYGPEQVFAYPTWYYDPRQLYANNYQIYTGNFQMDNNYSANDYQVDRDCPSNNNQGNSNRSVNNNQMDKNYLSSDCQMNDKCAVNVKEMDSNHSTNDN